MVNDEENMVRDESSCSPHFDIEEVRSSDHVSMCLQDSVLFYEIVNHLSLVAIGPACERGEEEVEGEDTGHHALSVLVGRKGVSYVVAVPLNCRTLRGLAFHSAIASGVIQSVMLPRSTSDRS